MVTHVQARPVSGAIAAPRFPAVLARFGRAVWNALHDVGASRARRELARLAAATSDPVLAAQLRRVISEDWLTRG